MKTFLLFFGILVAMSINAVADSWIEKSNPGNKRSFAASAFIINGKAYVTAGIGDVTDPWPNELWQYDPASDVWTQKANIAGAGRYSAAGFSIGDYGYVATGDTGESKQGNDLFSTDMWQYNSITNAWTQKANFGGSKREGTISFAIDGKGYVGTGYNDNTLRKKDFWQYDPSTDTWAQKADYGGGYVSAATAFVISGKGYAGTGNDNYGYRNDFWEYDPSSNTWNQKANFAGHERTTAAGFSIGNKGYIGTGFYYDNIVLNVYYKDFWEYDASNDTWTQVSDVGGSEREGAVGFSISDKGYVGFGIPNLQDFWEYTPNPSCGIPASPATTNITSSSAQLNWNTVASATKYKVKWKESSSSTWTTVTVNAPSTTTTLTGLSANTKYKWKVKSVCGGGVTSDFSSVVKFTTLLRLGNTTTGETALTVYPNPVITSTTISFSLEQDSWIIMELLDLSGRKMKKLLDGNTQAGNHQLQLNRDQLSAGIYFLQVKMNGESEVMKMVVQ